MLRIGCHLSSSKGYCAMAKDALKIHANTFQYFSRNPRGGNAKALDQEDIARFLVETDKNDIHPFLAHAPYIKRLFCRPGSPRFCQTHDGR